MDVLREKMGLVFECCWDLSQIIVVICFLCQQASPQFLIMRETDASTVHVVWPTVWWSYVLCHWVQPYISCKL